MAAWTEDAENAPQIKAIKPRLDEVYWWGKQKGMRTQGAEAS